jgi:hypothetical protein
MEAITSYVRPSVVKPKIYAVKKGFIKNPTFLRGPISSQPLKLYSTDYWFCKNLIPDDGDQPKLFYFLSDKYVL